MNQESGGDLIVKYELKSWPEFFGEILAGRKTHDLRKSSDRDFQVGDFLKLREFDKRKNEYTGRELIVEVSYITSTLSPCAYSTEALKSDFCILSIRLIKFL